MNRATRGRSAFTLVELLVVIAIIGILVALLLPAVQAAREAGRRTSCSNNLHQIAVGLHNYHDINNKLPPAMTLPWGGNPNGPTNYGPNWVIKILPFMEQDVLFDRFDLNQPINSAKNRPARSTSLPTFYCPSDMFHNTPPFRLDGGSWARGNYAINAYNREANATNYFNEQLYGGIAGVNEQQAIPLTAITDGTSNTLMVAEVKIGVSDIDRRGTWAMGEAGASILFWHGFGGDANGPNPSNDSSDDITGCNSIISSTGLDNLRAWGMTCWQPCPSHQAAPRSFHAGGGVLCAFCDASVHFVSNFAASPAWSGCCSPWDRLIARSDGAPVDMSIIIK